MSSINLISFVILALFTLNIVSEITVLTPNEKFYGVVNETLPITWSSSGNDVPQAVTIKLISKTQTSLFTGEYAVGQSIPTSSGNYAWRITDNLVGDNNWVLKFYNALSELNDKTPPVAQSKEFSIKPAGTKPPANDTITKNNQKNDSNNIFDFSSFLFIFFSSFISSIIIINQF